MQRTYTQLTLGVTRSYLFVCALVLGCHELPALDDAPAFAKENVHGAEQTRLNLGEERLDRLTTSGTVHNMPWAGSDWPVHSDSINYRWHANAHSPAEKYDDVMHGWRPNALSAFSPAEHNFCPQDGTEYYEGLGPLARTVHRNLGTGFFMDGSDSDGDGDADECDDLDGISQGWGLSHARVAVGMLEVQPIDRIEVNGVRFEPTDLSALLIGAYQSLSVEGVHEGCQGVLMTIHPFGSNMSEHCEFMDAKDVHLGLADMIGRQGTPMGEFRIGDEGPEFSTVIGFDVVQMDSVDPFAAMSMADGVTYDEAYHYYTVLTNVTYLNSVTLNDSEAQTRSAYDVRSYRYILVTDDTSLVKEGHWHSDQPHVSRPLMFWRPQKAQQSSLERLDLDWVRGRIDETNQAF